MPKTHKQIATHLAVFIAGVLFATAALVEALPSRSQKASQDRYGALDSFAQALSLIANSHVDVVDERRLIYGGISGMVQELDAHSVFYPPRQYKRLREDTEGEFGGVGVELGDPPEGGVHPIVERVITDSPCDRAGIAVGDRVLAINGLDTSFEQESASRGRPSSLRGPTGTRLTLSIVRSGWPAARELTLVRERITIPSIESERFGDIAYVAIRRFREATTRDLQRALKEHLRQKSTKGLILDLRGNPGGLLDQGISVADTFIGSGTIVSVVSRGGRDVEVARARSQTLFSGIPMVVVVDQNSASASEIVAGALQDSGRAKVVGVPSYGKGSVQTLLDLEDGSGIKLTTSRYLTPKGRALEGAGIVPDLEVEAFEALVVSPGASPTESQGKVQVLKGVNSAQMAKLAEDPQLSRSYQHLIEL